MGRIQGLDEKFLTEPSALIKSGEGYLFSVTISYKGSGAGFPIVFRDGTDGGAKRWVVFMTEAAQGNITKEWPNGKKFNNGIFWDPALGAGEIYCECTFK